MKFNIKLEDIVNKPVEDEDESYCDWSNYIVHKIIDDSVYRRLLNHEYSLRMPKKSKHSTKKRTRSTNQRKTIKNARGHVIF